jgi:flavin-dependent dehydrogenase
VGVDGSRSSCGQGGQIHALSISLLEFMMSTPTTASRPAKIVVVGAGPAGATCALELRRHSGGEVLLLDSAHYPRRKVCGSGLSPSSLTQLEALDLLDGVRPLHLAMKGMRAIGPGGGEIILRGSKGAWVVPRTEFDHHLVQAAVAAGATLGEGTRVTGILRDPSGDACGVQTRAGDIEADLVVIATGSPSPFDLDDSPREGIRTIMGWYEGRLPDQLGTMVWSTRLRGYYAWAFPEPGDVVNIGLTIREDDPAASHLRELFTEILAEHFADYAAPGREIGRWAGHPATVTHRVGNLAAKREILVGEAARLVCPGTVEGISFAMQSGRIAAATVQRTFSVGDGLPRLAQKRYQLDVAAQMLPSFLAGEALYQAMRQPKLLQGLARLIDPQTIAGGLTKLVGEVPLAAG